ncbi:MAG: tRNA (adenosine(37)-N6)-threonylcarbamoyltransferase complex ATPase subunit type 1 TsaE [Alphaproteobacteria bacterium]|jgi:tRNA threonylcarbamoyladenosine biosynthesis protein TsaE
MCTLDSVEATRALGARLAGSARQGDTIALRGDLGAGKTSLVQGFVRAKIGDVEVTSPTFTLVQTYGTQEQEIWHVDLYRIEEAVELVELGLEDAFDVALVLIEWPERMEEQLPGDRLDVLLEYDNAGGRLAVLTPRGNWLDRRLDLKP